MKKLDVIVNVGDQKRYNNEMRMTFIPQVNMFYVIPNGWYVMSTNFASNPMTFVSMFARFWSSYSFTLKAAKTALQKYYEETKLGKELIDSWIETIDKMKEEHEAKLKNINNTTTESV